MTEFVVSIITYIYDYINLYYFYSFCLYSIILLCFFTFSLPGGIILLIGSGFFFGFIQGFLINIFSISLGSLIFIIFSKTLLNKIFKKYYNKFSNKLFNYIKNSSYEYLILIRLLIGLPLVFQNISISILKVSKIKIFVTSLIGFTPLMLLFSYLGSYASSIIELKSFTFSQIFSPGIIFMLGILIILISLRIYFKK
mgnify:CR=1 FL=1